MREAGLGETRVANIDKINELIQTVRILNWEIRGKLDNVPGGDPPENPLFRALADLRNNELTVSQTMRNMSLADTGVMIDQAAVIELARAREMGARHLLSEFGTAREAILSLLRGFRDEEWTRPHGIEGGTITVEQLVDNLIESDKEHVERIRAAAS